MDVMFNLKDITVIDINGVFQYCTFVDKNEIIKRDLSISNDDLHNSHHYQFTYKGKKYALPTQYNHLIDNKYEEWRKKRHDDILKYVYIIESLGEKYDKKRKSN